MNIVKRFVRTIRSKMSKRTNKRTHKKQHKSKSRANHKGGAIYSFNLNDKIGGLPANIALNGTQDGDCPNSPTGELGFTNYGMTPNPTKSGGGDCNKKQYGGGDCNKKQKNKKAAKKSMKKSMKHKKSKTSKHKK